MDLPTWMIEILRQFPMVVVIGLAVWWTYNRLERREIRQEEMMKDRERRHEEQNEKLRLEIRRAADAEIERNEQRLNDTIADKNKEIDRLSEQLNRVRDESRSSEATNIAASLLLNIRCGKRQNSDSQLGRGLTSELKKLTKEVDQLTKKPKS